MGTSSTTFIVGNWLAAFVSGLILLWLLIKWGHKLPKSIKLDDIARIFVAVFCVAGPLYATPRFHDFALKVQDIFKSGALGITVNSTAITIVGTIIVLVVAGWYLSGPTWSRLFWLVVVTLPLFTNETMLGVAQWWTNTLGSLLFRGIINLLNSAAGF
jgi:hypothetical protein